MNTFKKLMKYLLFIIPLLCGTVGFHVIEHERILDSIFRTVTMYVLNYGDTPPNILVEVARWAAPLVSAYSIMLIISVIRTKVSNFFHCFRRDAVTVYGPEEQKKVLLLALGRRGVNGNERLTRTKQHVLLWDETENLKFYERNIEKLADRSVYMKCDSFPAQTASDANLHFFSPEETAARLYWKENCLYELSRQNNHQMKIIIIGFGRLGKELLQSALQYNIFSPKQEIEYHIFEGDPSFLKIHHSLEAIEDKIIFHAESWQDNIPLMNDAAKIIVLQQDQQIECLSQVLLAVKARNLDVFSENSSAISLLDGKDRINCFAWSEEAFQTDHILSEDLYRRAKTINLRYAHIYTGTEETEQNLELEWAKLDTFTRYSNISAADYHEVRLKMLESLEKSSNPETLDPSLVDLLAELEHMRWCRYHWLNNWTYGLPKNGKNKDAVRRIHIDLRPFSMLPDSERQKNRETVILLLEMENAVASP